jgi:hypothetical protein
VGEQRERLRRQALRQRGGSRPPTLLPWEPLREAVASAAQPWNALRACLQSILAAPSSNEPTPAIAWIGAGGARLALLVAAWIAHGWTLRPDAEEALAADGLSPLSFSSAYSTAIERHLVGVVPPGAGLGHAASSELRRLWRRGITGDPLLSPPLQRMLGPWADSTDLFAREVAAESGQLLRDLALHSLLGPSPIDSPARVRLERARRRARDLADLALAGARWHTPTPQELRWLVLATRVTDQRWSELLAQPSLRSPLARMRRLRPLHWELEFPQVLLAPGHRAGLDLIVAAVARPGGLTPPYAPLLQRLRPGGWLWLEARAPRARAIWLVARGLRRSAVAQLRRPHGTWLLLQRPMSLD